MDSTKELQRLAQRQRVEQDLQAAFSSGLKWAAIGFVGSMAGMAVAMRYSPYMRDLRLVAKSLFILIPTGFLGSFVADREIERLRRTYERAPIPLQAEELTWEQTLYINRHVIWGITSFGVVGSIIYHQFSNPKHTLLNRFFNTRLLGQTAATVVIIGYIAGSKVLEKRLGPQQSEQDRVNDAHFFQVLEEEENRLKAEDALKEKEKEERKKKAEAKE